MNRTTHSVTLSEIPDDTSAVCPENEKITNIQITEGRYQKYLRIIFNIKLLYLSLLQILSIINLKIPHAFVRWISGIRKREALIQFVNLQFLHKGAGTYVQKTKAVHGCRSRHCSAGIYAHTCTSVNNRGQQELIPAVLSLSSAV